MPHHTSRMCLFYDKRQLTGRNVIRTSDIPDISYYLRLNVFAGLISVSGGSGPRAVVLDSGRQINYPRTKHMSSFTTAPYVD